MLQENVHAYFLHATEVWASKKYGGGGGYSPLSPLTPMLPMPLQYLLITPHMHAQVGGYVIGADVHILYIHVHCICIHIILM